MKRRRKRAKEGQPQDVPDLEAPPPVAKRHHPQEHHSRERSPPAPSSQSPAPNDDNFMHFEIDPASSDSSDSHEGSSSEMDSQDDFAEIGQNNERESNHSSDADNQDL